MLSELRIDNLSWTFQIWSKIFGIKSVSQWTEELSVYTWNPTPWPRMLALFTEVHIDKQVDCPVGRNK